jgi:hypothetical protein
MREFQRGLGLCSQEQIAPVAGAGVAVRPAVVHWKAAAAAGVSVAMCSDLAAY